MEIGKGEAGVGDGVRSAVDVNAGKRAAKKRIRNLGETTVQTEVMRQSHRRFCFPAVGAARSLEFEAPVVGDVDLLVGAVNQEHVGAQRKTPQIIRNTQLEKVCCRKRRARRPFDHATRILTGDAAPIAAMKTQRNPEGRSVSEVQFRLEPSDGTGSGCCVHQVGGLKAEEIVAEAGIEVQALLQEIDALLDIASDVGDVSVS